ncbi:unnamed protein product [Chrysoparadoxa australica]
MRERKRAQLAEQGITLEEYEAEKAEALRNRPPRNNTISAETREKISQALKARWKEPVFRESRISKLPSRKGVLHSPETRERISNSVKKLWEDPEYREKLVTKTVSQETRQKLSQALKAKWQDPEFREQRLGNNAKTEAHRQKISTAIKRKWEDPEYRQRATKPTSSQNSKTSARQKKLDKLPPAERDMEESRQEERAKYLQMRVKEEKMDEGYGAKQVLKKKKEPRIVPIIIPEEDWGEEEEDDDRDTPEEDIEYLEGGWEVVKLKDGRKIIRQSAGEGLEEEDDL